MSSSENIRQWRIVAIAVVSSSGRPLFLKNFPVNAKNASSFSNALFRSNSLIPGSVDGSDDGDRDGGSEQDAKTTSTSTMNQQDAEAFKVFAEETKKANYISSWANPQEGASCSSAAPSSSDNTNKAASEGKEKNENNNDNDESNLSLDQALSLALDCEDYTETETAQLFLYAALDRIDARRATEERRSGNPFESRGYAVFDRETKTKMKAFVLVRYWGRSLPSECHLPCQTILTHLIQKATYAYCDPFRDVALDEPISENLLMDPFFRDILRPATELPKVGGQ